MTKFIRPSVVDCPFHLLPHVMWGDIDMKGRVPVSVLEQARKLASEHSAVPSTEVAAEEPMPAVKPTEEPVVHPEPATSVEAPLYNKDGIQLKFVPLLEAIKAAIERRKTQKTAPSVGAVPALAPVEVESEEAAPALAPVEVESEVERPETAPTVRAAHAPAPVEGMFRVACREFGPREEGKKDELHGASFLTEAGVDGKPKEVATQCALSAVVRYLMKTRPAEEWLWGPLQKTTNMHALMALKCQRGKKKMSLWDILATDDNKKVKGLFKEKRYWDNETGEWRGYYLEESHPEAEGE